MRPLEVTFLLSILFGNAQCSRSVDVADHPAGTGPESAPIAPIADADPAVRVPLDGLALFGDRAALVTVVAFTDYECPYCAKADRTIASIRAKYGPELRVAVAMRPLPMHANARPAARAFIAAAEQGKAEAMHARLFANTGALADEDLRNAARDVGLDLGAFDRMRAGADAEAAIVRNEALATSLDARGTPTFFVNGRRVQGAQPLETFEAVIDEELAKAERLVVKGVAPKDVYAATMANAVTYTPKPERPAIEDAVVKVSVDGAEIRGPATAPVTIAMFSDFECPYCTRLEATLTTLAAEYPKQVRIAFRQHPLPMHEHARLAAKASLAAAAQGQFWAFHDVLLQHRDALDRASLERYATDTKLDLTRFDRDFAAPPTEGRVVADEAEAQKLGVTGTPTTFVNGHRIVGAQPITVFRTAVERALTE